MIRKVVVLCVVSLCAPASLRASDESLPSVDDAIAKYVEAIGGRDALDGVKSMRMSGKMVVGGGIEAPMIMEMKRPDRMRMEFTFQGMTAAQAFDGEIGWFVMPFMGKTDPEKMPPDMVKEFKKQADFVEGPLVNYKKKGHKIEMEGADEFEGTPVYKLKVTRAGGDIEHYMLDQEYFIPLGTKGSRMFQGTPVEFETVYGDYKEVDGLMMPHSIQSKSSAGMGGANVVIEKIELNVELAESRFTMPEKKTEEAKPAKKESD